jgi:hypothetical protein
VAELKRTGAGLTGLTNASLHGFTAVAELKRVIGRDLTSSLLPRLHGFTAVAELNPAQARILDCDERCLHGLTAVAELKLDDELKAIREALTNRSARTVAEGAEQVERLTGCKQEQIQIQRFLRTEVEFRWRRTRVIPCPPKEDLSDQLCTFSPEIRNLGVT